MSRDPLPSRQTNLYQYLENRPLDVVDPLGTAPMTDEECCAKYFKDSGDSVAGQVICCNKKAVPCSNDKGLKDFFKNPGDAALTMIGKCVRQHEALHIQEAKPDCSQAEDCAPESERRKRF